MNLGALLGRRLRRRAGGIALDADIHAVLAANVGERRQTTAASSKATAATEPRKDAEPSAGDTR